jgi:hypothetical protein
MRRFGTERADVSAPLFSKRQLELGFSPPPRRRHTPTKAELRALGQRALAQWRSRPR